MEKLKSLFSKNATNKMLWITLIIGVIIILATIAIIYMISYAKPKTILVKTNPQENEKEQGTTINLEDLTDTSKLSEEELQKLNEKEIEEAEKKEDKKNTTTKKPKNKYYIKVNYGAQLIDVYTYDTNGKYTKRVKTFICSTGTATPRSGVYRIPAKIPWCKMIGDVYGHYTTQIVGDILFHSVPYLKQDPSTLEYWAYDKLGTKASLGCIRMTTRDAMWIYYNVPKGTQVEFYSDAGQAYRRPTAQKISNAPAHIRGWDPTDPDSRNPWRTYKPSENKGDKNNTASGNTQNGKNEVVNNQNTQNGNNQNTNHENTQTGNHENVNSETTKPGNNEVSNNDENSQTGGKPGETGNNEQSNHKNNEEEKDSKNNIQNNNEEKNNNENNLMTDTQI